MVKVSVIVPVYNPGTNIDDCIRTLLDQSLPPEEYEAIFVDDGSTDETPARLDALAAEHANVRVEHIPNSGWPGRPRNVGTDMARGEFVYYVDNDDWIGHDALERLYATAKRDDADIVIGKVVGHGKVVPRTLFTENRSDITLEWTPLLRLLTPHKLFRREFLAEHGIRFPEGRRRLEDHVFTVHAYFHARGISVLADYPCYHWMLREDEKNASWRPFDPVGYFGNVREVLDLVEEHTEPGPERDRLLAHWYRGKMLGRVGGGAFVRREPEYNRALYEEIHRLAVERYGPEAEEHLPFNLRLRSRLLREGTYESLHTLAEMEAGLRAKVSLREVRREGNGLFLRVDGALVGDDGQLAFVSRDDQLLWEPPESLRHHFGDEDLAARGVVRRATLQLLLRSRSDRSEYVIPAETRYLIVPAGAAVDRLRPILSTDVEIDPATAAGGSRLPAGTWEVVALISIGGFIAATRVRRRGGLALLVLTSTADGRIVERRRRKPRTLRGKVARRVPWLAGLVRRGEAAGDATAPR